MTNFPYAHCGRPSPIPRKPLSKRTRRLHARGLIRNTFFPSLSFRTGAHHDRPDLSYTKPYGVGLPEELMGGHAKSMNDWITRVSRCQFAFME